MGLVDISPHTSLDSFETLPPSFVTFYLWDACSKGKLFDLETFNDDVLIGWINTFSDPSFEKITFPKHFEKQRIKEIFKKRMLENFSESDIIKLLGSLDTESRQSLKNLVKENEEKARKSFDKFIDVLKQDIFPPILWMEYNRFYVTFIDTTRFMGNCVEKWFRFAPRTKSHIKERNRLVRTLRWQYRDLAKSYADAFLNYFKMWIFLELWSCENESELFTDKLWDFKKIDSKAFDDTLLEFHDSISELRRAFMVLPPPKEVKVDFSKPMEWAFKQLVQMVEVNV